MFPTRLEGIVFDLDATLVNLGGFVNWREAHKKAFEVYIKCNCPEDMVQRFSKMGLFNMINLVREENLRTLPPDEVEKIQKMAYDSIEECEAESIEKCELMPGCDPVLEWIKEKGILMGIATSNSEEVAKKILEVKGIKHYFETVVGRRSSMRMKPNPDPVIICLQEMNVPLENSIMIGDSIKDVRAAKAAGIYVIAVPAFFTKKDVLVDAGVDEIIDGLDELPEILSRVSPLKE